MLWGFFSFKISRLLSYVTKKTPQKKNLITLISISEPPEDVYPLLCLSISSTSSIWPIFFFQNNDIIDLMLKKMKIDEESMRI